jgi:hypothetical protein
MSRPRTTRTDAVTRRRLPRAALLHWLLDAEGCAQPDWSGRSARFGYRGVWTGLDARSITEACRRQVFERTWGESLREKPQADVLVARVRERGEAWLLQRLGLACRASALAVGQQSCREAMAAVGSGGLLLVSADAGSSTRHRFAANARRKHATVVEVSEGSRLGQALGREFVSCAWTAQAPWRDDLAAVCHALFLLPESMIVGYEGAVHDGPAADAGGQDPAPPQDRVPGNRSRNGSRHR